tara:strand:- start:3009 stop:4016 length:1008 start_codon:yes stop_codon:yes gene_type:complete
MAYKQPKGTPMHGAPMYSNRDGSSFNAEYDATQSGPYMKETYVSKDGASEPISAVIGLKVLGKKLIAGLTKKKIAAAAKKAAVKGATSLASRGAGKLAEKKNQEPGAPPSYDTSGKKTSGSKGGYSSGGASMDGASKVNFSAIFKGIGEAAKKVKSTTGMVKNMVGSSVKKAAKKVGNSPMAKEVFEAGATSAASTLADRAAQGDGGEPSAPTPNYSSGPKGYSGGGYMATPDLGSMSDGASYNFKSLHSSQIDKKGKGVIGNIANSKMPIATPIGTFNAGTAVSIVKHAADRLRNVKSRSNRKQEIQQRPQPSSKKSASEHSKSSVLSKYAKEI